MVKLNRTYAPKALSKTNREFKAAIAGMDTKDAYSFYITHKQQYSYNTSETKRHFRKMNHERCSFCTKLIYDFEDEMTVEHIRIKRDYPQKIFQWSNLLCACRACNTKRSTRAYYPDKYLDPTKTDDIEKYFCYQLDGTIDANEDLAPDERKKAKYMIRLYRLNREGLVCRRREFMRDLMSDDDFYEKLDKLDDSSQNIIFSSVFAYYKRQKNASYNKH
ncbi:MAG: TIGR02646 family protein [Lachnospiraceae bacterium]|nr:TIGR02646 family protein [Lachnospiraceae bacterium]